MTNSDTAMNLDGGAVDWRCAIQPALETNLMERIVDSQNIYQAWVRVRSNKGAPGIDGMRIEDFADYALREWGTIRQSLLDGRYQPTAVRRVSIPKPGGGERNLGVPCVLDRVI
jgi:RNA-directed DNA polymerase